MVESVGRNWVFVSNVGLDHFLRDCPHSPSVAHTPAPTPAMSRRHFRASRSVTASSYRSLQRSVRSIDENPNGFCTCLSPFSTCPAVHSRNDPRNRASRVRVSETQACDHPVDFILVFTGAMLSLGVFFSQIWGRAWATRAVGGDLRPPCSEPLLNQSGSTTDIECQVVEKLNFGWKLKEAKIGKIAQGFRVVRASNEALHPLR
ncbi:hypothetical protein V6N11_031399 [Hibiscus sabdariffa]|uniref:Uncharacterized protein n=1 Tax=Hibiscus sabdariffa TaxID=183260 RepID=A0ABR2SY34_9ROSI